MYIYIVLSFIYPNQDNKEIKIKMFSHDSVTNNNDLFDYLYDPITSNSRSISKIYTILYVN